MIYTFKEWLINFKNNREIELKNCGNIEDMEYLKLGYKYYLSNKDIDYILINLMDDENFKNYTYSGGGEWSYNATDEEMMVAVIKNIMLKRNREIEELKKIINRFPEAKKLMKENNI